MRFFRPELLTAIFFCLLSFVALLPPALVKLGRYEGDILDKLEQLVSNYDGLLVSIGTVFLVLALGIFTTDMVNSAQSRREQASRIMQAELAVAQFRQEWINSLRSKISEVIYLSSLLINSIKDEGYSESVAKLKRLDSEIRLHLNPKEDEAKRLLERLVEVVSLSELAGKKPYGLQHVQAAVRAREELASLSADYIKAEWEVIKSALNSAKAEWT